MSKELSRRDFIKLVSTAGTGSFLLGPMGLIPYPEGFPAQVGTFPREETLIARILTGRVGTPDNFNQWVGWKWQDRGLQNLADEPLWSVDFATGEIINGVADGDPVYSPDFTVVCPVTTSKAARAESTSSQPESWAACSQSSPSR